MVIAGGISWRSEKKGAWGKAEFPQKAKSPWSAMGHHPMLAKQVKSSILPLFQINKGMFRDWAGKLQKA